MSIPSPSVRDRRPLSMANLVIGAVLIACVAIAVARGFWFAAGLIALLAVAGLGMASYSRTRPVSDLTRVNAMEAADERESAIVVQGLAGVGAIALLGSIGALIVELLATNSVTWTAYPVIVLFGAWGVSNWVASRRS